MALKRWRWVLGPVLAAAVVLVVALPPRVPIGEGPGSWLFGPTYDVWVSSNPHAAAVRDAVRQMRWRLREQALADSIARAARGPGAMRSADGAVTVTYGRGVSRDSARMWLEAAIAELELYPAGGARGLPVVVAVSSARETRRDTPENRMLASEEVLRLDAVAGSTGACVILLNPNLAQAARYARGLVARDASGRPLGRFLDICALYGRFGVPGAAVAAWSSRGPAWYWSGYDRLSRRMQEARRVLRVDTVSSAAWEGSLWGGYVQWAPIACLRGGAATCARLAGFAGQRRAYWWSEGLTRGQLLTWLLATGTPAQFAAFWGSPLSTAHALEAAYGRPAGQLALEAFRHWWSAPSPGGPTAGARVLLAGLAWAALALGLAFAAGRHWTTEI